MLFAVSEIFKVLKRKQKQFWGVKNKTKRKSDNSLMSYSNII